MHLYPQNRVYIQLPLFAVLFSPALAQLAHLPPKTCSSSSIPPTFLTYPHHPTCPAPVDDESPISIISTTPWTSVPYCLFPSSAAPSSSSSEKLCVYTSSSYNQNAGICIIAYPDTAATLVPAVEDPIPAYKARRHVDHSHAKVRPNRGSQGDAHDDDAKYVVTTIPGKGKGVIATRHIDQFETIMISFPAMVVDNDLFPSEEDETPPEASRLFDMALEGLTDRGRFLALARSRGTKVIAEDEDDTGRNGKVHLVEDVIRTNAFGIYTVDGKDFKGLYPEIARLNHGCDPNAYGRYTKGDMAMSAVATRDIEPGEEVTISYIPLGMPTVYRTKALINWGFNCTCSLCSSHPEARETSDERRKRLVQLMHVMRQLDSSDEHQYDALVEYTKEFVELVQIERLFPKVGEYYQTFMKMYYDFGDVQSAYRYAKTALKFAETFADPEGGFCGGLRGDLEFLEDLIKKVGNGEGV